MNYKKDSHWNEQVEHPIAGKIETRGRKILYGLASRLMRGGNAETFSFENVKRILLVKEPYRMGDLMQITPLLLALKTKFPHLYIGLVVQDRNAQLFKHNPHVDRLFVYEKRAMNARPWRIVSLVRSIRKEHFDLAVTLETQRIHMTNDLFAFFSGAPFRMRYDGAALGNPDSNVFYNLLSPYDQSLHEVDRNCAVFKPYGIRLGPRELRLWFSEDDKRKADDILRKTFGKDDANPVLIHAGSYKLKNRWPLDHYLELGKRLEKLGHDVIYSVGPSEEEWADFLKGKDVKVVSGVSLLVIAAVLARCKLVLCNDTGILHIGAGVGTKTVVLFGNTFPEQWTPPGGYVQVLQAPDKQLSSIGLEEVWQAILSRLA